MLESIKNLYNSQELVGEIFLKPLKAYNKFCDQFSSDVVKWKIARVVAGIFAYPIFGILALIGLGIKLFSVPALIKHNERTKESMTAIQTILKNSETYQAKLTSAEINKDIFDQIGTRIGKVYTLNKTNVDEESNRIQSRIDYHNSMFQRTYLCNTESIKKGEIKVELSVKYYEDYTIPVE